MVKIVRSFPAPVSLQEEAKKKVEAMKRMM